MISFDGDRHPVYDRRVRLIGRILFLLLALILLVGGAFLAFYNEWRVDRLEAVQEGGVVAPGMEGDVQNALRGTGPPILVLHGTPGGYDQALLLGAPLAEAGFQIIAPSRSGYLGTPLKAGLTPEEFADTLAQLLNDLGHRQVGLLGFSTGAAWAMAFAERHPERVRQLALVSPVIRRYRPAEEATERGLLGDVILSQGLSNFTLWWLSIREAMDFPAVLRQILNAEGLPPEAALEVQQANARSPRIETWTRALLSTLSPLSERGDGIRNDIVQIRNLPSFGGIPPELPILLIRGELDRDVPAEALAPLAEGPANVELRTIPNAGHLPWLSPTGDQVDPALVEFFNTPPPSGN